jgi:hypothetical protein
MIRRKECCKADQPCGQFTGATSRRERSLPANASSKQLWITFSSLLGAAKADHDAWLLALIRCRKFNLLVPARQDTRHTRWYKYLLSVRRVRCGAGRFISSELVSLSCSANLASHAYLYGAPAVVVDVMQDRFLASDPQSWDSCIRQ